MIPFLEILIISTFFYHTLSFFWGTRAMDLVYGLFVFSLLFALANWLNLPVLQKLMLYVVNVAAIAILIIFQPEIRLALSKFRVRGRKYLKITEFDQFLEEITHTIYKLAEKRIGAIVLIENQDSLEEFANRAVRLNAKFSPELLQSIFSTTSPMHDGAVIIRDTHILSAATILPLADDGHQLSKSMGTRHRAALGISQITDTLVIVVSEETGRVSIARDGIITRGVKVDRFKGILRSVFNPPIPAKAKKWERLRQWNP